MHMTREQWLLLAGFLGVVGMQLATMGDSWSHVTTPSFISGVLIQTAILVRAIYTPRPGA